MKQPSKLESLRADCVTQGTAMIVFELDYQAAFILGSDTVSARASRDKL
jgi:hypothetical protein